MLTYDWTKNGERVNEVPNCVAPFAKFEQIAS
jgi:hypothetical protein